MSHKILYVEDEAYLAKVVKETLEHQGFQVHLEISGANVVETFQTFQPDICILDVMLPDTDGFILAKTLKKINQQIPIIFLTARSFTEDVLTGFEAGATDYIRKPFSIEELIARINNQLRLIGLHQNNKQSTTEVVNYALGTGTFYPEQLELITPETTFKLSYRETQVLTSLVENRNLITDRKQLLLTVWGDDSFFNSRTLDVYMRKLRTYLEYDNGLEIITLKGKGYILRVP